jgi:TfoX/Sxy family transcriptional regulator of competence genes
MKMPKKDTGTEAFFRSLLPQDARITVRPMFGHVAAFVNGNMFAGTFGKQTFVRLSDDLGAELTKVEGTSLFSPMQGRPMRGYVVMPSAWEKSPEKAKEWVARSLSWAATMPPKKK